MDTLRSKTSIGLALVIFFVLTLASGITLHLKKHGILIEPRSVIKIFHWCSGLLMVILAAMHYSQFWKVLQAMKQRYRLFWLDSWLTAAFLVATFVTGAVKLLSHVKIPHLGLWHYWLGLIMAAVALLHLVHGVPVWRRMRHSLRARE